MLIRSKLVSGIIPPFLVIIFYLPQQKERIEVLENSQMELNSVVEEGRPLTALTRNPPYYWDNVYKKGYQVPV